MSEGEEVVKGAREGVCRVVRKVRWEDTVHGQ